MATCHGRGIMAWTDSQTVAWGWWWAPHILTATRCVTYNWRRPRLCHLMSHRHPFRSCFRRRDPPPRGLQSPVYNGHQLNNHNIEITTCKVTQSFLSIGYIFNPSDQYSNHIWHNCLHVFSDYKNWIIIVKKVKLLSSCMQSRMVNLSTQWMITICIKQPKFMN